MPKTPWRRAQEEIALQIGGQRNPGGSQGKADISARWFEAEVRVRLRLPQYALKALALARVKAGPNKLGVAILHQIMEGDSLVVMSRNDFIDWFAGGEK